MIKDKIICCVIAIALISCKDGEKKNVSEKTYPDVNIVGAMKNVMWKGELSGNIALDTISNKKGLYGLGPVSYLKGELLINNGKTYVSSVTSDTTMTVEKTDKTSAPFFVYANVTEWNKIELPENIITFQDVEKLVNEKTTELKRPFAFKLKGKIAKAIIHIQNLPPGSTVSSPKEAHQGQVKYKLVNEDVTLVGFFSTEHKGVFTHHDSNVHLHLITEDESKMGHLDELEIHNMTLYLPVK